MEVNCFNEDWKLVKCPVKDEDVIKEVKKHLKEGYHIIRNCYKYLAAVGTGTGGGPWYINLNTYTDFVKMIGFLNTEEMRTEADVLFKALT